MKGIVFTEFLEMVEKEFGLEVVDDIVLKSNLPSNAIYTSVRTYDFIEMQSLIANLSKVTGIPANDLIYAYGRYFFNVLNRSYHKIFEHYHSPLEMLASIENHIHVEVRKLYPDAELPSFKIIKQEKDYLEMLYFSERSMYMFAKALMEKTFEHYHAHSIIELELLNDDGSKVRFKISQKENAD